MADDGLRRFLGGSPLAVLIKLALLSILVGFVLTCSASTRATSSGASRNCSAVSSISASSFEWLWRYLLLGAVIVIPIWLVMRLVQSRKR